MTEWSVVRRIVATLPQAVERVRPDGATRWSVRRRDFAWQHRAQSAGAQPAHAQAANAQAAHEQAAEPDDRNDPPALLATYVTDAAARDSLVAADPAVYVVPPGDDARPVVLLRLARAAPATVAEALVEAWLLRAPRRVTAQFRRSSW